MSAGKVTSHRQVLSPGVRNSEVEDNAQHTRDAAARIHESALAAAVSVVVFRRHSVGGSGLILHEYGSDGRCQVRGCDVFDPTEGDSLVVSE